MREQSSFWGDILPRVEPERCRRCADCPAVAACLAQSFRRKDPDGVPAVDESICFGCYSCAGACPHGAILLPGSRQQVAMRPTETEFLTNA